MYIHNNLKSCFSLSKMTLQPSKSSATSTFFHGYSAVSGVMAYSPYMIAQHISIQTNLSLFLNLLLDKVRFL